MRNFVELTRLPPLASPASSDGGRHDFRYPGALMAGLIPRRALNVGDFMQDIIKGSTVAAVGVKASSEMAELFQTLRFR
jgi:hypothetical protein